jgi:hypothetical protein
LRPTPRRWATVGEHDDLTARLREHADRVAGGGPSDPNYDPETLSLEHEAADALDSLEADLERARFHYVTERDVRNGRLVEQVERLYRERDELAATVERVRAIHQPVDEEAEVWADGPGEDLHDQFVCSDDPSACLGHLTTIKVCRECGYEHDGEQPIFRGWPCPTIKALGADTEVTPDGK